MEIKRKSLTISAVCLTIAAVLFVASLWNLNLAQQYQANIQQKTGLTGHVTVYVNGEFWCETPNSVVDIGEKRVRDFLGGANATGQDNAGNITKYISLSAESAPADTATQLTNEYTDYGLTRAAGTVSWVNVTSYKVEKEFTCSAASKLVTSSGLHWDDSGDGNMYCCADLSNPPTLDVDDTCKIVWTLSCTTG